MSVIASTYARSRQEPGVPVNEQVARVIQEPALAVGQVPRHLSDPVTVRVRGDSCDLHPAGVQAHRDEDVQRGQPVHCPPLDGREVDGRDGVPVRFEKRLPSCHPFPNRGWFDAVLFEDIPDGSVRDLVVEIGERALDPVVAPGRVLPGHAQDEAGYVCGDGWPSGCCLPPFAVVPLLGDQPPVPAQDRVGRDDRRQLHQRPAADRLALGCQDAPLVVGEEEPPPSQLVHEGSDLGVLELDDLLAQVFAFPHR
jgi:hypothetical protein